ncbi:MAG: flagellar hook-length control protein FliK [Clostridiales bacterium]|nr:flagellar hook-length control protein FliK [Clostridiales bacterium]
MEINKGIRLKQQRLQKAATEYESSISKAQHIKSSRHEQTAAPYINENKLISGEIIDLRYQEVKIRLEPGGQVLTARVSGDLPLSIGQMASFIVSDKTGDQITLKLLSSSNTPVNDLVFKALFSSGLGASERNIAIAEELLKYKMPLDKNTILSLIKLSSTYPDTDLTTLTLMHKNNLPINESSIAQFTAYQEGSYQIVSDLNSLTVKISDALFKNQPYTNTSTSDDVDSELPGYEAFIGHTDISDDMTNAETRYGVDELLELNKEILNILREGQGQIGETKPQTELKYIFNERELMQLQDNLNHNSSLDSMTLKDLFILVNNLSESGHDFSSMIKDHTLTAHLYEAFIGLADHMSSPVKEKLFSLLSTTTYEDFINEALHNRWTLSPKDLATRDNVSEYFSRLKDDLKRLAAVSTDKQVLDFENIKSSINKLQDNLQFMRDLNDLFLYIQLPMRLTGQDAHGDLYVFTKKNQSPDISEQISVLLHLDMANLGSMDIHMTMKDKNIHGVFYLEEASQHIISKHLDELIDILSKKGYNFQASTKVSESKADFINGILEQDIPQQSLYRRSFDIRA